MTAHTDDLHKRTLMAAGALAEHATGDLRRISVLTDEEILALVPPEDLEDFDLPWVTGREEARPDYSRDEARLTALRSLMARGGVLSEDRMAAVEGREVGPDPGALTPSALFAGILARRALAPSALHISSRPGSSLSILRVFADHDGSVMHELISPNGVHHVFMSDLEHACKAVLARLDPQSEAAVEGVTDMLVSGSQEEIRRDPHLGPVLAAATHESLLRLDDRFARERTEYTITTGTAGTVVLRPGEEDSALEAVSTSAEDLHAFVASLLEPSAAPS